MPPHIELYELGPTRSARCRWALLEAGLPFETSGGTPDIIHSDELRALHPLGKLPAARINGEPLFESAAIATAVADLVPERKLIAPSGTRARAEHDQWVSFALTELEAWAWTAELNTMDFVLPESEHVPAIVPQCRAFYRQAAKVVETELAARDYLVGNRFSVTDIIVGYTLTFGEEFKWHDGLPAICGYLERLRSRPHCTLPSYN